MANLLTIGADVELFTYDGEGTLVPAFMYLDADKNNQMTVSDNLTVHHDNAMLEFGVPPADAESSGLHDTVPRAMVELDKFVTEKGLSLSAAAKAIIPDNLIYHPAALEFGCNPDFDAWAADVSPQIEGLDAMRVAGGHIHLGVDDTSPAFIADLVKMCDVTLGIFSIFTDEDDTRYKFYGKPGRFRPKPYGVEYRVLSNYWVTKPVSFIRTIDRLAHEAVHSCSSLGVEPFGTDLERVKLAIETKDKDLAMQFLNDYYYHSSAVRRTQDAIYEHC